MRTVLLAASVSIALIAGATLGIAQTSNGSGTAPIGSNSPSTGLPAGTLYTGRDALGDPKASVQGQAEGTIGDLAVDLDAEQRATLREKILTSNVHKVAANFAVSAGAVVPRLVRLRELPPEIVRLMPQFEGCSYIVLADSRIVVIKPATYEIVTVITV